MAPAKMMIMPAIRMLHVFIAVPPVDEVLIGHKWLHVDTAFRESGIAASDRIAVSVAQR
jgi:hypothetical protein